MVSRNGKTPEVAESVAPGETVHFKEPIQVAGLTWTSAPFKSFNVLQSQIPVMVPEQTLGRNGQIETHMKMGMVPLLIPTGIVICSVEINGVDTTISVPLHNISVITEDKDFLPVLSVGDDIPRG